MRGCISAVRLLLLAGLLSDCLTAQSDPDAIATLPLDEGSGTVATDTSGNGNDGTLEGNCSFEADSTDGSAFSVRFGSIGDRIDLGGLDVNGSGLTLAAWLRADSFPGPSSDPRIISKASGSSANDHVFMLSTIRRNGKVRLRARARIENSTTTLIASSGDLSPGAWRHAAVTHDGSTLRLYLDAVEVGNSALPGSVATDPAVSVAVGNQPAGAGDRAFDGLLDDVRILQRALTAGELAAIVAGNTPPMAVDDQYGTGEDAPLLVNALGGVLSNDSDPDQDPLQAVLVDDVISGVLDLHLDGSFDYTPNANFNGQDSFTYVAHDGSSPSNPALVILTVTPVNDPPLALDDSYQILPDTALFAGPPSGLLANDSDPDLDALQAVQVSGVASGVLNLNADGSFDYTPNAGFSGQDSFTYKASDALLASNPATVTIHVQAADPNTVVLLPLDEGSGTVAYDVSGRGNDGTLEGGVIYDAGTGNGSAFSARFGAAAGDRIDLGVVDVRGSGLTLATWINADSFPGPAADPRILSKASGTAGDQHVFMLSTIRSGSAVRLRGRVRIGGSTTTLIASSGNLVTGAWRHAALTHDGVTLRLYLDAVEVGSTPLAGTVDVDVSVSVAVGNQPAGAGVRPFDGRLDDVRILQRALSQGELAVIVGGNTPPVAQNDQYGSLEDATLAVDAASGVLSNDSDADLDPLQALLVSGVSSGVLVLQPDGSFNYTPNQDFNGLDSFSYQASDGSSTSSPATVTLTVSPVNDAPVATDDAYQTLSDAQLLVDAASGVLSNDSDPDLDVLQAQQVTGVSNGVLNLNLDGSFDYTPSAGFSGQDSFTYRADDGLLKSALATVTLFVASPPTAVDDAYAVDEDNALSVPATGGLLSNDVDNEGPDDLFAVLLANPTSGTLSSFGADGSFTFVPNTDFNGVDTFMYAAIDGLSGASASATVVLTVNPINDLPVALDDCYSTAQDTPLLVGAAGGVLANDYDVDLDPLVAVLMTPSSGVLSLNADGSFDYTPNSGYNGEDTFTYWANDSTTDSNLATVRIAVGQANSPPQIITGEAAFSSRQVVDTTVDQVHAVVAADFNGDGLIDVAATDFLDGAVYWYENDGAGGFEAHVLDNDLLGAYPIHAGDVDLDGDQDVLAGGYLSDTFAWYECDGAGGWTRHLIDTAADGAHSIVTGDMDQDGDVDLLASNQDSNSISWYENDGSQNFTLRVIDTTAGRAKRAEFADMDGDGDWDVCTASFDDEIAWLENDGSQGFTKRVIDAAARGSYYVFPADLDGDGDMDLLAALQVDDEFAWYQNDGKQNFTRSLIDSDADGARAIIGADLDGDGYVDAIGTSVDDDTVAWYANDGKGVFTRRPIDPAAYGAYAVFAADMDADGDLDVLSGSRDSATVAIHPNVRSHEVSVPIAGTLVFDTTVLLTVDANDGPTQLLYALTVAPANGNLELDGAPLFVGGTFTQQDIDDGRVAFVHVGFDLTDDFFAFTVADGGEDGIRPAAGSFVVSFGGPVAQLPLDEGSGTLAADVSGQGNDGTLMAGAMFEASTADGSPFAVRFDGVDDSIHLPGVSVAGTGLTLMAWMYADSFPGSNRDPRIISRATGVAADDHVFMLGATKNGSATRLRARVRVGGSTTTLIAPSGDLSTGVWSHAALTHDGITLRLYLDGVEVTSTPLAGLVDLAPTIPIAIGAQPPGAGGRHFDGLIDDVRILNMALTASQIAEIAGGGG